MTRPALTSVTATLQSSEHDAIQEDLGARRTETHSGVHIILHTIKPAFC